MNISIETIPHDCQRYPTVGDWQFDPVSSVEGNDTLLINVSSMGNQDSEFLIALHEMVEAYLCRKAGITDVQVDEWDMSHLESEDPGFIEGCPYKKQHDNALWIESIVATMLKVNWGEHCERVDKLFEEEK